MSAEAEWRAVSRDGQVKKKILQEGKETATPPIGSTVSVHYVGTLTSNGKQFDASKEPFLFELGQGQVIRGWDLGVKTMVCFLN